ncbi:cobaltochelatase subunit CobN [Granulicella sp. S190]|uniref:cobaltochelatase subunit CobN n=1 Tax=Granulicella sp. S190 TaxID=1747226 RepID=UPI00131B006C|nr:cobaltochelatase subunit CobN [Granulicella sp. S190]
MHRQRVVRADGRPVNIVQRRAHLSYCFSGCCCGRTERGYAQVPVETYKEEWTRRKMRNTVHLTKAGCLGPCVLSNVASLVFDGRAVWFHSVNSPWQVIQIFAYIDAMLEADRFLQPPEELLEYVFNFYDWDARPAAPALIAAESLPAKKIQGIALLTHADTDLVTLQHARAQLPADIDVFPYSLNGLRSEEQMTALMEGALARARVVVLRLHGPLKSVAGFALLRAMCVTQNRSLIVVSGTGEMDPEFLSAGTVDADVVASVTTYLQSGGTQNIAECLKFLSDRLLLTGHGYEKPAAPAEHGIYMQDLEHAEYEDWLQRADSKKPTAAVLFYRAHLLSGNTAFVDALAEALESRGLNALCIFTSSMKALEGGFPAVLRLVEGRANVIVTTLSFAMGEINTGEVTLAGENISVMERLGVPVVQAISSGMPRGNWEVSRRGLNALETAINVALPEFDGRIISVPVSFKERGNAQSGDLYVPHHERVDRVAGIAARLAKLQTLPNAYKRVAFVLTNSSTKAAQVGNAVGLDSPASLLNLLRAMKGRRYSIGALPESADDLIHELLSRGTYDEAHPLDEERAHRYSRAVYRGRFERFPEAPQKRMKDMWGQPGDRGYTLRSSSPKIDKKLMSEVATKIASMDFEPWSAESDYLFAAMHLENALIAIQPPRGYGLNPDAIYHTPDLPPTHHYTAFYQWLATSVEDGGWGADAIVHVGKHGTLEWLPGKSVGLSGECFPDLLLEDMPLIYPFIINDPGEGSQSKRRGHAVIVDHLTPPMTSAETYGPLAALNQLVNEYYAVEKLDPSKLPFIQQQIWELIQDANLKTDLDLKNMLSRDHGDHKHDWEDELTPEGVPGTLAEMSGSEVAHLIEDIDGYLCELGMAQIRDGLHILGNMPPLPEMLRSMTRLVNVDSPSLLDALARNLGFDYQELLNAPGKKFDEAILLLETICYTHADVLEVLDRAALSLYARLEELGFRVSLLEDLQNSLVGSASKEVSEALTFACQQIVPNLERAGDEVEHVLDALEGRYIPAGPAGAPTRGMAHILPTGRNFYAVDPRALPSEAAWRVGQQLAREAIERYRTEEKQYPETVGLSAWGTSQMRTHGDDVSEVLALLGVQPVWNKQSRRPEGITLIPLEKLGRPRIDVTLRISGFFRDAFPHLIDMIDDAVALVIQQDEPLEMNFPRKHYLSDLEKNRDQGAEEAEASARFRIFGAKPGTYGAGIQALMETQHWKSDGDIAQVFLEWGGYAYGRDANGVDARGIFGERLKSVQVALHNQDNREHDIFDSDDYFQFHGGMVATIRALTGVQPKAYFGDSSRPDAVRVRDLREEALRVYRSRVINPKWIESIKRHGYKGGLELTSTVDYIFGFDATAHIAPDFVYEGLAQEYALDANTQEFLKQSNPWALNAIAERLLEANERGLWEDPKQETLEALRGVLLESESLLEARGEARRSAV